ncbi:MAG: GNAT family N-acetyltransferase [Rhodospirillales bacterium]|nr:GNAT family N-acetyltransferase [Rhodospirillales bacterium]
MNIRAGRAEDADFLAWAILASQRGHVARGWLDIALELPESQTLAFARRLLQAQTRSWWHASRFFIGEVDNEAAGALCALPNEEATALVGTALQEAGIGMGWSDADMAAVRQRGAYVSECWMPGDPAAWVIEHVAVRPAHRGRAIAQALLAHAMAVGRNSGCDNAQITFLVGNAAAERCYAKAGFAFAEQRLGRTFERRTGAPGLRRFVRRIRE